MSIDNVVCPECKSRDIAEEEEHNLLNLSFGLLIGAGIGAGTGNMELIVLGSVLYFTDIPFGADREYYCTPVATTGMRINF
ncbi:MAG TPA: hypothetical protein VJG49_00080 [Candidatus Nanoarchaeia archaeon]|nr:hypothetical protein [Candidatus Nanoarchaeia archaeon]